ncbi:MAG TPA: SPFH domain-containing protein [Myxococcota bacterium]|nr:SPFH domain-containing protein [Myxococcota bacterium]
MSDPRDVKQDHHTPETDYGMLAPGLPFLLIGLALVPFVVGVFILKGLVLNGPNMSQVVMLFGRYKGTIRRTGYFWINPFTSRTSVSLKARNFESARLKVNDLRGNPVEIGAVVVWRVRDTAQALFDVENYESYVSVQTESAIRGCAARHPYDSAEAGQTSLRGDGDDVNAELQRHLTERLALAGVDVLEVRLTHLAYAPEIAGVMLRRQQAEAILDARSRIVEGAVGMVRQAIDQLDQSGVVHMDDARKASLVSNLLVVLCSERDTTPVVNAGSGG